MEVDLEGMMEDLVIIRLAHQFPLVREEVGLTLGDFDLNVSPTLNGEDIYFQFLSTKLMGGG